MQPTVILCLRESTNFFLTIQFARTPSAESRVNRDIFVTIQKRKKYFGLSIDRTIRIYNNYGSVNIRVLK